MIICVFGASITWGACDYEKGGWVERLKMYCLENLDRVDVYNVGVSGNDTNNLLERFESEAKTRKADFIIFDIGANDAQYIQTKDNPCVSLGQFKSNISELTDLAKKITNKIVFIGPTIVDESKTMPVPWDGAVHYYSNANLEKYGSAIKEFCEKNSLDYINMNKIVQTQDLEDGLHPNSGGHEKIFKTVLAGIAKYLNTEK